MSCAQVSYCIELDLKQPSDHAPLIVDLHIIQENICVCKIVLKSDSKEKVAFLLIMSKGLSQLNFYTINSVVGLNSLFKMISEPFVDYWVTYIKRIIVTTQSKE